MKIFITGATGFIGTHLLERLSKTEHELVCLVRPTSITEHLGKYKVTIKYGDVTDKHSVQKAMEGCDWVVHLANVYSMWEPNPAIYEKINVEGTRNVLEACVKIKASKVIYLSTAAVYGKPETLPFNEDSRPGTQLFSNYAYSKLKAENISMQYCSKKGIPVVILQPGICLGENDNKPSGQYIRLLLSKRMPCSVFSKSLFAWTAACDVALAIIKILESPKPLSKKYLIGAEIFSLEEFNNMICQIANINPPKINIPPKVTLAISYFLTIISNFIKTQPLLGLAYDQAKTMNSGIPADGSRITKELCFKYTPVIDSLRSSIKSL